MRVLRLAALAQDDGDGIGFPRFACHSERSEESVFSLGMSVLRMEFVREGQ